MVEKDFEALEHWITTDAGLNYMRWLYVKDKGKGKHKGKGKGKNKGKAKGAGKTMGSYRYGGSSGSASAG